MLKGLQTVELLIVFYAHVAHSIVGRVHGQSVVMEVSLKG
jgi:hypothetical protein